ncbi:MAG: pyridoxal phosphate-dependent aminotransferase [Methanocellales archaeon]
MVPRRLVGIEESATIKISEKASELKRRGIEVINFGLGEPDFITPKHISEAAKQALDKGYTHYVPSAGIPELRRAIAEKLRVENNLKVNASNIIVTPGTKQAIYEAAMSLLEEGDEAILFDPAWVSYEAIIKLSGAKVIWASTYRNSLITELLEKISSKTKLIVINTPCNPSGAVLSKQDLKAIADIAIDHDLYVLSDEIYEKIIYDGEHFSIGSLDGMEERTITINGFSKSYAMTGWRLGYAAAPREILNRMIKIQQHSVSSATSFAQYGGLAALTSSQECVKEMVAEFKARRDLIVNHLEQMELSYIKPDGAFYVFVDIAHLGRSLEVAEKLLNKAHIAVTPGAPFGPESNGYIRISYATSQANINEGMRRMKEAIEKWD